ncbi:DUF6383 domain-containing protein [uncultured Parabacteroides sp.]|uniref:DUF6383 domain-containing protein n=1 Tax=uncultured Parabacteroides sp. TaxID=512312 RepID=UPI0025FB8422|nr:DUF6383 domain-containing protein [uncultured Parabacteroides sp.]
MAITTNYKGVPDSLIAVSTVSANLTALATGDSALWKIETEKQGPSAAIVYTITNKACPTVRLSFGGTSNAVTDATHKISYDSSSEFDDSAPTGYNDFATVSGSATFAWSANDDDPVTNAGMLSFAKGDSILTLSVWGVASYSNSATTADRATGTFAVKPVKILGTDWATKGVASTGDGEANPIISLKAVAADKKVLTVKELNSMKKEGGFQLFAKYDGAAVDSNNPLAGVTFKAVKAESVTNPESSPVYDDATADKAVFLEAVSLPKKDGRPQFLFVDTTTYATNAAAGEFLKLKVDTLPRLTGEALNTSTNSVLTAAAYQFVITTDPSHPVDSVAVFATSSYELNKAGNEPRTFDVASSGKWAALQIEVVKDAKVLTTKMTNINTVAAAKDVSTLSASSRLSFTGTTTVSAVLALDKVYSVKSVNKATSYKDQAGKYWVNVLGGSSKDDVVYSAATYKSVPATQFIYNGFSLVNRENPTITTNGLAAVDNQADTYTNGADTLEIKAIEGIDIEENTIGYAYMSEDSLKNYAFSLDYVSGLLSGLSINVAKDSAVMATEDAAALFKLEAGEAVKYGAENSKIAQLEYVPFMIYRKEISNGKKTYVVADVAGRLVVTNETSEAGETPSTFYLKNINDNGEVILINATNNKKYNVNSTTAKLEEVALTAGNNAFKVQVEKAPEYVLDAAQKHITFTNSRGDKLTADKNGFAVFRAVGEELKATCDEADFALYVDTAQGLVQNPTDPTYYILKGAKTGEKAALEGNFLRVMTDSLDKEVEGYSILVNNVAKAKLAFVPAKRLAVGGDSLIVNYQNETLTKADSIGFTDKTAGIDQFQFRIQYTENDGEYVLRNAANYIAVLNDVIFLTDKANEAAVLSTESVEAPTANDATPSVTEVKVIAANGGVQIVGAAGKMVVITNILGQTVANTVLTSSDTTIATPAGVVVVAIEGEEAVKAIVK